MRRRPDTVPDDGFTLIEVLVSLTILSIALTVLFAIFGQSLDRNGEARRRLEARALAQSLLAQAETSEALDTGDTAGRTASGLEWRLVVRPYGSPEERKAWAQNPAELWATVSWGSGTGHALTLSTLRILPKENKS
jgi:prepilin-type N-terminal cleavage/methylation domain-containing protein